MGDEFDKAEYRFINTSLKKRDTTQFVDELVQAFGASAIAQVLDAFKDLGFRYATQAGVTISKNDVVVPPSKPEILAKYEKLVQELQDQYDEGLITQEERHLAVTDQWNQATDEVADAMVANLDELNPIYMMANSGARGSFKQIRQLAGMRGLMANPKGEIIERPVKANFMEGLDVLEYFTSTHGARKGLADTALRTADSGYLTRRLVDVAQDVIIRIEDCGTDEYIEYAAADGHGRRRTTCSSGRVSATEFKTKRGPRPARAQPGDRPRAAGRDPRGVRRRGRASRSRCARCSSAARTSGVCQTLLRPLAGLGHPRPDRRRGGHHRRAVDRRARHAADHADVPHRRRRRRGHHARPAAHRGAVRGAQAEGPGEDRHGPGRRSRSRTPTRRRTVVITDDGGEEHRETFPRRTRLLVEEGQKVEVGEQLNEGNLYPHELLSHGGADAARAAHPRRGLPRRAGAGGLQVPGRGHQRQAHRADRAPDAQEGPGRPEGRHEPPAGAVRRPPRVPQDQRRGHRARARRAPRPRRSSSASRRRRWRRTRSCRRPPSRRPPRCSPTRRSRARSTASRA